MSARTIFVFTGRWSSDAVIEHVEAMAGRFPDRKVHVVQESTTRCWMMSPSVSSNSSVIFKVDFSDIAFRAVVTGWRVSPGSGAPIPWRALSGRLNRVRADACEETTQGA